MIHGYGKKVRVNVIVFKYVSLLLSVIYVKCMFYIRKYTRVCNIIATKNLFYELHLLFIVLHSVMKSELKYE